MGMYFNVYAGPYIRIDTRFAQAKFDIQSFCWEEMDEKLYFVDPQGDTEASYLLSNRYDLFGRSADFDRNSITEPFVDPDIEKDISDFKAAFQEALDKLKMYAEQCGIKYDVHWGVFSYYS